MQKLVLIGGGACSEAYIRSLGAEIGPNLRSGGAVIGPDLSSGVCSEA